LAVGNGKALLLSRWYFLYCHVVHYLTVPKITYSVCGTHFAVDATVQEKEVLLRGEEKMAETKRGWNDNPFLMFILFNRVILGNAICTGVDLTSGTNSYSTS
jgi:hypothetical protein